MAVLAAQASGNEAMMRGWHVSGRTRRLALLGGAGAVMLLAAPALAADPASTTAVGPPTPLFSPSPQAAPQAPQPMHSCSGGRLLRRASTRPRRCSAYRLDTKALIPLKGEARRPNWVRRCWTRTRRCRSKPVSNHSPPRRQRRRRPAPRMRRPRPRSNRRPASTQPIDPMNRSGRFLIRMAVFLGAGGGASSRRCSGR